MSEKCIVLTIAGSDPCGGAGIQADIRTADRLGVYPCAVISTITAQNSQGFLGAWSVGKEKLESQLDAVFQDFIPDAVKIGFITDIESIQSIARKIEEYDARNVVIDPVLSPTLKSGNEIEGTENQNKVEFVKALIERLFPLATLVTPNLPEKTLIEKISGQAFDTLCSSFLLKDGHGEGNEFTDTLYLRGRITDERHVPSTAFPTLNFRHSSLFDHDSLLPPPLEFSDEIEEVRFTHKRIETDNTHGSGCVLSMAIACGLAKGMELKEAAGYGERFLFNALKHSSAFNLTRGSYGPSLI